MSRIGKQPVAVPANVEVTIDGHNLTVKGPKGELHRSFNPMMTIAREGDEIIVSRPDDSREAKSLHGLTRTLIHNMVEGVENGFQKKLQLVGVGYRAALKGRSKRRAFLCGLCANVCSAALGYFLAEPVWQFVVSIS